MPGAVENTRELASRIGIDDVVTYEAGDALKDDLGISSLDTVFPVYLYSAAQYGSVKASLYIT